MKKFCRYSRAISYSDKGIFRELNVTLTVYKVELRVMNVYNSDTKRKFDRNIKHMQEDKNTELREERVESRTVTPSQSNSLLKDLMIPISINVGYFCSWRIVL